MGRDRAAAQSHDLVHEQQALADARGVEQVIDQSISER
jgi:hypothetical protein